MEQHTEQKCSTGNNGSSEHHDEKSKFRNFCFTSFLEQAPELTCEMKYLGYGSETCPTTGKHHWQGFLGWKSPKTISAARKCMPHIRIAVCKGSLQDNINYCSKESELTWLGKPPLNQGKRTDLIEIRNRILDEGVTVDELCVENPIIFHQYGRTLERLETLALRKVFRTEMTKGIWISGPTGTGKSHAAMEGFTPETHYILPLEDNGWWDGYKQQDTVIINEFRGQIEFATMLSLVDKWPMYVKRRNKEPVPFTSKKIIVTSPLRIREVWETSNQDSIDQMCRRFEEIRLSIFYHQPETGV